MAGAALRFPLAFAVVLLRPPSEIDLPLGDVVEFLLFCAEGVETPDMSTSSISLS